MCVCVLLHVRNQILRVRSTVSKCSLLKDQHVCDVFVPVCDVWCRRKIQFFMQKNKTFLVSAHRAHRIYTNILRDGMG